MQIVCDASIRYELREFFTFKVPNSQFHPKVKAGIWDGNIRLFNAMTGLLYKGLEYHVRVFAKSREYEIIEEAPRPKTKISDEEIARFVEHIKLPFEPRYYQIDAFRASLEDERSFQLCPTASGKSLIAYMLSRYYLPSCIAKNRKVLLIVPTVNLVEQMATDFEEYGAPKGYVHKIRAGADKETESPVIVSTWQSLQKLPKKWFDKFELVIGDEGHLFQAKALKNIMEKLDKTRYRTAMSGTLHDLKVNKLVLEGLFGPIHKVISTKKLMAEKFLAELSINAIVLKYTDDECKLVSSLYNKYQEEVDWIVRHPRRLKYIAKLANTLEGNTLVLFQFVDKHGKPLVKEIQKIANGTDVHYIAGSVKAEDREAIRKSVSNGKSSITVASFGTFSTGANIPNLDNIIFASPSKSRIRVLQSIGRGLRTTDDKNSATLYDIADDLTHGKKENYTIKHFAERVRMYIDEGFKYRIYNVDL